MLYCCTNPFAPSLEDTDSASGFPVGDLSTVDKMFQNFTYAYSFRDTTIYGQLLAPDFSFSYRDYDIGADITWGRSEEMRITNSLFRNTQSIDLIWNEILSSNSDSTRIVRSFNLTVTINPLDIFYIDGKADLYLRKTDNKWQIYRWNDESNF